MIKRKSRAWVAKLMKQNSNWNILDLGGGPDAWEQAKTVLDYVDYSEKYKDRRFVQGDATNTPFKDKEFDFVICTHVIEHVVDPELLIKEIKRISHAGYIEFPTPLFDNLVFGNDGKLPHGHIWWVRFCDDREVISLKPRLGKVLRPSFRPEMLTDLAPFFSEEMQTGLYWKSEIPFSIDPPVFFWESNNSTGKVLKDYRKQLIYVDSKCGRFLNFPYIIGHNIAEKK